MSHSKVRTGAYHVLTFFIVGVDSMCPFGNIGKINLIPAIGLASNLSSEIDRKASGCFSCPFYASLLKGETGTTDQCATCNKKKNIYQNEKSRYTFKPLLTKSELLIFMALHLYNPSSTGIVINISVLDLARDCHITLKTVYEGLRSLTSKGYIFLDKSKRGAFTILINDYDKYYLPANKGGRGYIVITRDVLEQFVSIKGSVNALRYAIRSYINIDMTSKNMPEHSLTHTETIRQALSYLPSYLRPCHIKKIIMECLPCMFQSANELFQSITISLDPVYYGPTVKNSLIEEEMDEIRIQLEEVLDLLHKHETGQVSIFHFPDLAKSAHFSLVHLRLDTKDPLLKPEFLIKTDNNSILSLAQISLQYGRNRVLQTLKQVWQEWKPGSKDQMAYLRTILST